MPGKAKLVFVFSLNFDILKIQKDLVFGHLLSRIGLRKIGNAFSRFHGQDGVA